MIIASSSPVHDSSQLIGRDPAPCPRQMYHRRNTVGDSAASMVVLKVKRKSRPKSGPVDVIEQADSLSYCSRQPADIAGKKPSSVEHNYKTDYTLLPSKANTLPRSFSRRNPQLVNEMAWRSVGKQRSPSPSPNSGGGGDSSWLETISTKISEKKRKSGIFGSLRGRNKDKKKDTQPQATAGSTGGDGGGGGGRDPKSPLITKARTRSDTDPASVKKSVLQTKPSSEFQGSTGFQFVNPPVDVTDSGVLRLQRESAEDYPYNHHQSAAISGSYRELSLQRGCPHPPGVKHIAHVKKSSSLPRTVLCSPVVSRKAKQQQLLDNQWSHDHVATATDDFLCQSTSPPSSNMSSRIGSVDTLQPSINMSEEQGGVSEITPTRTEGWQTIPITSTHKELVPKTSLTRSSSLPFEAEILSSEQSVGWETLPEKVEGCGHNDVSSSRFATRSQSFNTHFNSHSVVQKTRSYEEVMR